jgi:hypothetical protein
VLSPSLPVPAPIDFIFSSVNSLTTNLQRALALDQQ